MRIKRRIISLILTVTLLFSCSAAVQAEFRYSDWFRNSYLEMLNKMHTPLLTLGSLMCRNEDETYLALWLPGLSYLCDSAKPHAWYIKRYCVFLLLPSEMSDRIEN